MNYERWRLSRQLRMNNSIRLDQLREQANRVSRFGGRIRQHRISRRCIHPWSLDGSTLYPSSSITHLAVG